MDDNSNSILKWLIVAGVAGWFVYDYLQKSTGAGAQQVAANTFTNPSLMLAFCAMNPNATVTFIDASGNQTTQPAVIWMANDGRIPGTNQSVLRMQQPQTASAVTGMPASNPAAPTDPVVAALQQAAGGDSASVDQWNAVFQQLYPGSPMLAAASSSAMDAQTYLSLRRAAGISPTGNAETSAWTGNAYPDAYRWEN